MKVTLLHKIVKAVYIILASGEILGLGFVFYHTTWFNN